MRNRERRLARGHEDDPVWLSALGAQARRSMSVSRSDASRGSDTHARPHVRPPTSTPSRGEHTSLHGGPPGNPPSDGRPLAHPTSDGRPLGRHRVSAPPPSTATHWQVQAPLPHSSLAPPTRPSLSSSSGVDSRPPLPRSGYHGLSDEASRRHLRVDVDAPPTPHVAQPPAAPRHGVGLLLPSVNDATSQPPVVHPPSPHDGGGSDGPPCEGEESFGPPREGGEPLGSLCVGGGPNDSPRELGGSLGHRRGWDSQALGTGEGKRSLTGLEHYASAPTRIAAATALLTPPTLRPRTPPPTTLQAWTPPPSTWIAWSPSPIRPAAIPAGAREWLCQLCGQVFSSKTKLYKHKQACSNAPPRPTCDVCGHSYVSETTLANHRARFAGGTCQKRSSARQWSAAAPVASGRPLGISSSHLWQGIEAAAAAAQLPTWPWDGFKAAAATPRYWCRGDMPSSGGEDVATCHEGVQDSVEEVVGPATLHAKVEGMAVLRVGVEALAGLRAGEEGHSTFRQGEDGRPNDLPGENARPDNYPEVKVAEDLARGDAEEEKGDLWGELDDIQ